MANSKPLRILVLKWEDEIIMDALHRGLKKLGHESQMIQITPASDVEDVIDDVVKFKPDFCLTHNYTIFHMWFGSGLEFEKFLKSEDIPVAVWLFDSPIATGPYFGIDRFLFGKFPANLHFFSVDRLHMDLLKFKGLSSSYLPIAADEAYAQWKPQNELLQRFKCDLSFTGRPFESFNYYSPDHELCSDFYFSCCKEFRGVINNFGESGLIPETRSIPPADIDQAIHQSVPLFQGFFNIQYNSAEQYEAAVSKLYQSLGSQLPGPLYRAFLGYMGRLDMLYSYYQLIIYLRRISDLGLRAYGGDAWGLYSLKDYKHPTPRLSQEELLSLFSASKVSFCYTKWQFRDAVHERPFLIYAVGGFPLTDFRSGLEVCFEKDEIVSYRSIEEARDLILYYQRNETERLKFVEKGRARVLRDHTYTNRAQTIVAEMASHFGMAS